MTTLSAVLKQNVTRIETDRNEFCFGNKSYTIRLENGEWLFAEKLGRNKNGKYVYTLYRVIGAAQDIIEVCTCEEIERTWVTAVYTRL